jgi:hypothetical protein
MLGDLELRGTEAVSGEGSRQSDSKYFHLFQNNACYEFELNVTTNAPETAAGMKHVDRDRVFTRLENILATVKINPVAAATPTPEVATSDSPHASPAPVTESSTSAPADPAPAPDVTANAPTAKEAPAAASPAVPETSPQK